MIKRVNLENAKKIYKEYMESDFSDDELPKYEHFVELIEDEKEIPYVYMEEDVIKAYIVCIEKNGYILISHLAVLKKYRGQGIGTKLLEEIKEFYKKEKAIILESEAEDSADEKRDLQTIIRRQKFYERCGFIPYNNLDYELTKVKYLIFVYNLQDSTLTNQELKNVIIESYKDILKNKNGLIIKIKGE